MTPICTEVIETKIRTTCFTTPQATSTQAHRMWPLCAIGLENGTVRLCWVKTVPYLLSTEPETSKFMKKYLFTEILP
ncbi:MAG: hypothetical protein EZS28_013163 [Streblomastix strix]|uniref:Uncharacterized protein n=1 Tax=Streblomastix strix TaxID=222440 RepID=A0A5J4W8P6_9EUKA|nr:MAG: hypothetical protein EZS28_013163 [Streblomastix strix]